MKQQELAVEYAKAHTNTRCHLMGESQGNCPLGIRFCDYRSRYEAYLRGCDDTLVTLAKIPWDEAMESIAAHAKSLTNNV